MLQKAFTKVRAAKGPLAPWGAYYEAEQDLNRGKPAVAVRECETYLKTWPDGVHADACHRLIARGLAETGRYTKALEAAEKYDSQHPRAPISWADRIHDCQTSIVNERERRNSSFAAPCMRPQGTTDRTNGRGAPRRAVRTGS